MERKEAIEIIKKNWPDSNFTMLREVLETLIPELKESEDEKIRKVLRERIIRYDPNNEILIKEEGISQKQFLAWLEKQAEKQTFWEKCNHCEYFDGYDICLHKKNFGSVTSESKENCKKNNLFIEKQAEKNYEFPLAHEKMETERWKEACKAACSDKNYRSHYGLTETRDDYFVDGVHWADEHPKQKYADKVEPKFKTGDWVTSDGETVFHITIDNNKYQLETLEGTSCHYSYEIIERKFRLWTIQDAKDGDILSYVTDGEDLWIMIYWSLYEPYDWFVHYHALLVKDDFTDKGTCCVCIDDLKPATKEQHDLLFQKMKEAGYEWDAEKKELKKIDV